MPPDTEQLRKKIIVIYSPGGGNGKSEIAANIAYSLAKTGYRTWVLDANLYAPTQDLIFGLDPAKKTFSDYLIDPAGGEIPVYDISEKAGGFAKGSLLLTPSTRDDPSVRFSLKEKLNSGGDFLEDLPQAIFHRMNGLSADILIIDTYPSFEQINEVWLGMTRFLLIISRLNEVDVKNVRMLLQQENVEDIMHKLIVFNNIRIDKNRIPRQAIKNETVPDRISRLKREAEFLITNGDCKADEAQLSGNVEIFGKPILYSERLSLFRQSLKRDGLFIHKEPSDPFSASIRKLADYICTCWHR
jgi:MinD-like ATPase involved in chromosome partitioning or flagellar assembly